MGCWPGTEAISLWCRITTTNVGTMAMQTLVDGFKATFGRAPERMFFSPGRVNLIGEYTDFNGGYVLPAAIDLGTYFAARQPAIRRATRRWQQPTVSGPMVGMSTRKSCCGFGHLARTPARPAEQRSSTV